MNYDTKGLNFHLGIIQKIFNGGKVICRDINTRDTLKCRVFLARLQVYVNYHMNVEVRRCTFIHVTKKSWITPLPVVSVNSIM